MQKYIDEKCLYCSSFFCFLTLHAGTGGIRRFLGFLIMLVFQSRISTGAPNGNFRENICSEDDLRTRIFGTFVVKFLACLPLLGFLNIYKMV